jgi:hypothetical protein
MLLAAAKERQSLQEELDGLQEQMDAEIAAAEMAAEAARAASAATYSSCTIEEVVEEPMEMFQVGGTRCVIVVTCVCLCMCVLARGAAALPRWLGNLS